MSPENNGRKRGSTFTTVLVAMPVIIGSVAMGVDWGQVLVARVQAQAAADEGALAAGSALVTRPKTDAEIAWAESLATSRAHEYAGNMQVNNIVPTVDSVTLGYWDGSWHTTWPAESGPNAVEVVSRAVVPTSFATLFGVDAFQVTTRARAGTGVIARRAPDLVIAQDVTPSMSSTDIALAKVANAALVDCIEAFATPDTRGAFVKFANVDRTIVPLVAYGDSPNTLYNAAAGITSGSYTSSDVCLGSGGCTTHASGYYAAVDILNKGSKPPDGVGQAVIFITDGAPYAGGSECTSTVYDSSPATPYKAWLKSECGNITGLTTQTACQDAGGVWKATQTPPCRAADNGAESTNNMSPGTCSNPLYLTEARCEGNGGTWFKLLTTTPKSSLHVRWAERAKTLAQLGTWRDIDVYAVFYSADASATYKNDNIAFLEKHVVRGAGAEIGVLDAPTGDALTLALREVCMSYTGAAVGLLE